MKGETIETFLEELRPVIDKKIEEWIPRKYDKKSMEFTLGYPKYENSVNSATKSISEPFWDFFDRGGKKWRPAFMILVAEAFGKKRKDVLDFVIIPEVIHNGTLVIDEHHLTDTQLLDFVEVHSLEIHQSNRDGNWSTWHPSPGEKLSSEPTLRGALQTAAALLIPRLVARKLCS